MSMCALHDFRNTRDAFLQIRSLRQNGQGNHYPDIALPELPENVRLRLKALKLLIPNLCPEKRESDIGI